MKKLNSRACRTLFALILCIIFINTAAIGSIKQSTVKPAVKQGVKKKQVLKNSSSKITSPNRPVASAQTIKLPGIITNYSQFYSAVEGNILKRSSGFTLKIFNFSKAAYNFYDTTQKVLNKNPGFAWRLLSISSKAKTSGSITSIDYRLVYAQSVISKAGGTVQNIKDAIKTQAEFVAAVKENILSQNPRFKLIIYKYDKDTFNCKQAVASIIDSNPGLSYVVTYIGASGTTSGDITAMQFDIGYKKCDYVANNDLDLKKALTEAISMKKTSIYVKYNKVSNLKEIYNVAADLKNSYSFSYSISLGTPPAGDIKTLNFDLSYGDNGDESIPDDAKVQTVASETELVRLVVNLLKNGGNDLVFETGGAFKVADMMAEIDKITKGNSEYQYFSEYSITTQQGGSNTLYKLEFTYIYSPEEVARMNKAVSDKVQAIINEVIKPGMSEYDKELVLHDYMLTHSRYDNQNYRNDSVPFVSHTAYGVLINGVGVCDGHANALKLLLAAAGIESMVVTGNAGGPHAWNIVKIDGEYYQLDSTFDHPITAGTDNQTINHDYFNITDAQMAKDHTWDNTIYPSCTSTRSSYK